MTETLKAIETSYKGYRFRSRLEARWAIYFDAMEMPWQYELEGYNLGDLGLYLPDFWLRDEEMFAEVKAKEFTVVEQNRCRALAKLSGHTVLMLAGPPEPTAYRGEKPDGQLEEYYVFPGDKIDSQRMADAITQSRSARFEHGETPTSVTPRVVLQGRRNERRPQHTERGASAERELIRAMLHDRSRIEWIAEKLGADSFREPQYRAVYHVLVFGALEATTDTDKTVQEILEEGDGQPDAGRLVTDSLATLRARDLDLRAAELDRIIPLCESGSAKDQLIQEKEEIRKELKATGRNYYRKFRRSGR